MKSIGYTSGCETQEASNWNDFLSFITANLEYRHFVWRGQRDGSWNLESTLDRLIRQAGKKDYNKALDQHLQNFKLAARGRRGSNPRDMPSENDWWALGQHQGLATPLLDWSTSPFVAAFFAYASEIPSSTNYRMVFGLSKVSSIAKSAEIAKVHKHTSRPPILEFVEPLTDENARLVNQGGLFTRSPAGVHIEQWINRNNKSEKKTIRLWKIRLPEIDRKTVLQSLNRMNINYLSLFPDLYGSSQHVNLDMMIDRY